MFLRNPDKNAWGIFCLFGPELAGAAACNPMDRGSFEAMDDNDNDDDEALLLASEGFASFIRSSPVLAEEPCLARSGV